MLVARAYGYETNPVGGFETGKLVEVFGLDQECCVPVVTLSAGEGVGAGYESAHLTSEEITTFEQAIKNDGVHLH